MTRYIAHNQKCYACGLHKGAAFLGYDIPTMKTFCLKNCKNPSDIPKRKLIPVTNEDLNTAIVKNFSGNVEETFNNLLGKVASVRLQPAHIMHILKIAEVHGFEKIQHTLVNIIESDMAERNMDHVELEGSNFVHKSSAPKDDEEEIEEIKAIEEENKVEPEETRLRELEERQAEENRKAEIPKEERDESEDDEWEI